MREIGSVIGFSLFASPAVNGSTTITAGNGGVVRADGMAYSYRAASISISGTSPGQRKRVFLVDPSLADPSSDGMDIRSLMVSCDDGDTPRGVYEGGLVVLGHVEIQAHPALAKSATERQAGKSLDIRERTSMLRLIRALAVMAKADGRGAAGAVEKQLQELGFNGPKQAAIRSAIDSANALEPDNKPL